MTKEEQIAKAQELLEQGNLEEARKLIKAIKEDTKAPKEEKEEPKEEAKEEADEKGDVKEADEAEQKHEEEAPKEETKEEKEEPEEENKKEKRSFEPEGDKENMEKIVLDGKEAVNEKTEVRSFLEYLRSKDVTTRAFEDTGVKSADAAAIIPEEIITKAKILPETVVDLRNKVTKQKVNHAQGSYPILKANQAVLASVEELKANPDLEKPQFEDVDYKVLTYRGQLAVSQEALDDSDDDLAGIIARHIQRQALNTANAKIAGVLKGAKAVTAKSIDDIKTQINTGFDPAYNLEFMVSQSFYNELDQMTDGDGRYLLQPDVTAQSGKQLLGRPVTILADKIIGNATGDKVAFLGQPDAFAVFFDRVETSVRWVEEMYYGQVLAVAMRFDVKMVDPAAGKYITFTPAETLPAE